MIQANFLKNIFILIAFLLPFFFTNYLTPYVIKIASRFKIHDLPDQRKQHKKPIVRLGGVAISLSFFTSIFLLTKLGIFNNDYFAYNSYIKVIIISSFFSFVLGFIDDLITLAPWTRLAVQTGIACYMWQEGIAISKIDTLGIFNHTNYIILPTFLSFIITILWIVGITNALNWIDGIDGLAISVSSIALVGNLYLFAFSKNDSLLFLTILLLGTCTAFYKYNFKPASIIMGDGGSYFIGFNLASISLLSVTNSDGVTFLQTLFAFFFVPIVDMIFVIFKRLLHSKSPFFGDRTHIHHRLINKGFNEIQIVIILCVITQWTIVIGTLFINKNFYFIKLFISSILMVASIFYIFNNRKKDINNLLDKVR